MDNLPTELTALPPLIEFIFPSGESSTQPILSTCRGLMWSGKRPAAFRFHNCTNEHVTDEFIDWYFSQVLNCLDTNVFKYRLSIATTPSNFQAILALPKEP